jgi:hypothetical protein
LTPKFRSSRALRLPAEAYLAIAIRPAPSDALRDARGGVLGGDVSLGGVVLKDWGLHLIDMNLALGDLVALVGRQAEAWR